MTDIATLTEVCVLDDIPVQGSRRIMTEQGEVALFRTVSNQVFALKNECPHKQGPLSEGIVHGNSVTCPLHNWVISLETGEAQGEDHGCTPSLAVEVTPEGSVLMALPKITSKAVA